MGSQHDGAPPPWIRLHPKDNVLILREGIGLGQQFVGEGFSGRALAQIPAGHKIAARQIRKGNFVLKFGTVIGRATREIAPGEHVHSHNVEMVDLPRDDSFGQDVVPVNVLPPDEQATFMGIVRPDGRVATRNYIGLVSTVNCSATVVRRIADWFTEERLRDFPNVDGVVAFAHPNGCGQSTGVGLELLQRTLGGHASHANLGGVVLIGLGCERNQVAQLMQRQSLEEGPLLRTLVMQEVGGTTETIQKGIDLVSQMLPSVNAVSRQPVSAAHLKIGLECGGSDGFSGISANPALGAAVDILVRHGGTAIISETTEFRGVEHLMTRRAVSSEVAQSFLRLMDWWVDHTRGYDCQFTGNVPPGNNRGGLANIVEKSLGSAMKAGTTPLQAVYQYAEPISASGLVLMDSPGYDPVAVTGQIASGANVICFTTGRGSMFGSKPAPTLKLASNSPMYHRLVNDMDVNCGKVLDGELSVEQMGQEVFQAILDCASGQRSKSEMLNLGDNEFVPWFQGIIN